jgi:hypothetical protein
MSGPVALLQGLCVFPREVQYSSGTRTLTRITEAWLVGEQASDGPTAVHANGLWIGLGLRGPHTSFEVGFGTRDGAIPTAWTVPSGTADVEHALRKAFGASTANWKGFHLDHTRDLPAGGPGSWDALFFRIVSQFQPNRPRDFHVVPIVVALAGGTEDIFGDSHYLLGLTVHTQSSGTAEDFMVVTHAMSAPDGHPALTIPRRPGPGATAASKKPRPARKPARVPPRAGRPAARPARRPAATRRRKAR